jgi:hypothetical protein
MKKAMKKTQSRLRRMPDELIIPDKNNGGKAKLMSTGVLECKCSTCEEVFWLRTNRAECCPVCGSSDIDRRWTVPLVAFIPEVED